MKPLTNIQSRRAATLIEVVTVALCIAVLTGLLSIAANMVRERSRMATCQNNLRQIGIGLHDYHTRRNELPAGSNVKSHRYHSWCTAILPMIEQSPLYEQYKYELPWNEGSNSDVTSSKVSLYMCPSTEHDEGGGGDYAGNFGSSYGGKQGIEPGNGWSSGTLVTVNHVLNARQKPIAFWNIKDGTSSTFMVVECAGLPTKYSGSWGFGNHCVAHDNGPINRHRYAPYVRIDRILSDHAGGANALMCDGAVRFLDQSMDISIISKLCTRAGNERMSENDLP